MGGCGECDENELQAALRDRGLSVDPRIQTKVDREQLFDHELFDLVFYSTVEPNGVDEEGNKKLTCQTSGAEGDHYYFSVTLVRCRDGSPQPRLMNLLPVKGWSP